MATASEPRPETNEPRAIATLADIPEDVLVKRYGTTRAEVNAIKMALAPPGTTDYEMILYMGVCHRLKLDPFVPGLVHFIRFPASKSRAERTGIVLGYLGYLQIAQNQDDCDGLEIRCFPEEPNAMPTHVEVTVYKKSWSHPLKVSVTYKEKRRNSPFWDESPRQALETAGIRRACRMAWPSVFAPLEDEDDTAAFEPRAVRGRVGTTLGDHHEPVDAEAKVLPAADPAAVAPNQAAPAAAARPEPVAAAPASRPAPAAPLVIHSRGEVEGVAKEIAELMDDPALDRDAKAKMWDLLKERLDARNLSTTWTAQPEDYEYLVALRNDLAQYHRTA